MPKPAPAKKTSVKPHPKFVKIAVGTTPTKHKPKPLTAADRKRFETTEIDLKVKLKRANLRLVLTNGQTWLKAGPNGCLLTMADVYDEMPSKGHMRKLRKALHAAGRRDLAALR